jgi:hypothetical protein
MKPLNSNKIIRKWPWLLTAVAIIVGILSFFLADMQGRSQLGEFLAGFASVIAFIWLIAAYLQQGQELIMQREELALQRNTLDLQREELKKMGKYAALQQIAHVFEKYEQQLQQLSNKGDDIPHIIAELPSAFTKGMVLWKTILESTNDKDIYDAYIKWAGIESVCIGFLDQMVTAIELYEEAIDTIIIPRQGNSAIRLYSSPNSLRNIPFIRNYIGISEMLSSQIVLMEPGLDKIKLKSLEALNKLLPGVVKEKALSELQEKVKAWQKQKTDESNKAES